MSAQSTLTPPPFELVIPAAKDLSPWEQLALYRAAYRRNPGNAALRLPLASLLVQLDQFPEALSLLAEWRVPELAFALLEVEALLSLETPESNQRCETLCRQALQWTTSPLQQGHVLATLGKVLTRLQRPEEARACLQEALQLNARDKDAYKRAATLDLRADRAADVLARAEQLAEQGVVHSRLVASQSLALAHLGRLEEAHASQGLEAFLSQRDPEPPQGWSSREAFCQALAVEMADHPSTRYGRYGVASTRSWRIDEPGLKRLRLFPLLQQLIRREVLHYAAQLPNGDEPFLKGRPELAELRNWCVIAEGDGHEEWHVHQNGWLSGTFYIQVPDHITHGTGRGGCIAFGLPDEAVPAGQRARSPEVLCRPHPGLMTIFPSHLYHRTYPHGGSGRRICYAFDIIPRG